MIRTLTLLTLSAVATAMAQGPSSCSSAHGNSRPVPFFGSISESVVDPRTGAESIVRQDAMVLACREEAQAAATLLGHALQGAPTLPAPGTNPTAAPVIDGVSSISLSPGTYRYAIGGSGFGGPAGPSVIVAAIVDACLTGNNGTITNIVLGSCTDTNQKTSKIAQQVASTVISWSNRLIVVQTSGPLDPKAHAFRIVVTNNNDQKTGQYCLADSGDCSTSSVLN